MFAQPGLSGGFGTRAIFSPFLTTLTRWSRRRASQLRATYYDVVPAHEKAHLHVPETGGPKTGDGPKGVARSRGLNDAPEARLLSPHVQRVNDGGDRRDT